MAKFQGIITALITPFTENGEVYEQGLRNEIQYLQRNGIENIFVSGSYGAFPIMTVDERKFITEVVSDECQCNNMKSIVHIGSTSTKEAIDLAKHAEKCKVDAISSVVPFYYTTTFYNESTYIDYFKTLLDAVSTDVHCYNNAKTTGYNVTNDLLEKFIDIGIVGLKDGSSDMSSMMRITNMIDTEFFDYYPSSTSSLITGFIAGAKSCISGVSLTVPTLINSIYYDMIPSVSSSTGRSVFMNMDVAIKTWKKVMKVRSALGRAGGRAIAAYEVLNYKGVNVGSCREPWLSMNREDVMILLEKLFTLGVL